MSLADGKITEAQALPIRIMHGDLGRACPELIDLSFVEAGDLMAELRAEVLVAVSVRTGEEADSDAS